jgi:hypothetical protein
MNLAPIIFATLVMSAFAAMPLKPDDALTGLLDEEPATPKTTPKNTPMTTPMTTPKTSLIDAFLDTKSKAGCVDCTGRERASDESGKGNINGVDQTGMSYCYRKDGDLANDPNVCDGYWGGSVDNPTYGTAYYACEFGVKTKNGVDREGCVNSAQQCCLDSNGDFASCAWETLSSIPDGMTCSLGERVGAWTVASLTECQQLCEADVSCNFIYFQSVADRPEQGTAYCHEYRTCDAHRSPSLGGTNYQRVCTAL